MLRLEYTEGDAMWRFGVCALALMATPALAHTLQYASDDLRQPRREHLHSQYGKPHRPKGTIEPSRQGPAPTGFWYRCDLPAGYYPYVPNCRTPWQIVPSAPAIPFR